MATSEFVDSTVKLSLVLDGSTQSIGTIKSTASSDDVYAVGIAINALQNKSLKRITKQTTAEILAL